jgi:hypothetical protein
MHTYVDLYFAPDGTSPLEVAERLRDTAGLSYVVGPHDLHFEWMDVEEFRSMMDRIHTALRGTGVTYKVESAADDPMFVEPVQWPPPLRTGPTQHPGYPSAP